MTVIRLGISFVAISAFFVPLSLEAFPEIPRESAKALGTTRGKPFRTGLVFVNGQFVQPPYVVERWGTGIRINKIPVSGQIVDWTEFVKTQPGASIPPPPAAAEPVPAPSPMLTPPPAEPAQLDDSSALDDLFSDDPKPAKTFAKSPVKRFSPPSDYAAKPTPVPTLSGPFVKNDASKALTKRINEQRTMIDRTLRSGGFICFGDRYARVVGDERLAKKMLAELPEILQRSNSFEDFKSAVRNANFIFLNEVVCKDLYRNRFIYRQLQELRARREGMTL